MNSWANEWMTERTNNWLIVWMNERRPACPQCLGIVNKCVGERRWMPHKLFILSPMIAWFILRKPSPTKSSGSFPFGITHSTCSGMFRSTTLNAGMANDSDSLDAESWAWVHFHLWCWVPVDVEHLHAGFLVHLHAVAWCICMRGSWCICTSVMSIVWCICHLLQGVQFESLW